jgi:hypothetical protein
MIIVPDEIQTSLINRAEYGMGYQKVIATLDTGGRENGIVVNAEVFINDAERASHEMFDNWDDVVEEARKSRRSVVSVQLVPRLAESLRGVRRIAVNAKKAQLQESLAAVGPAKDAPVTLTIEGEVFKRFSAYANDRRVTTGRGLTRGTFATTREDADAYVKTGTDAVHRYALENKTPASNVFTVTPPKETNLQRGIDFCGITVLGRIGNCSSTVSLAECRQLWVWFKRSDG